MSNTSTAIGIAVLGILNLYTAAIEHDTPTRWLSLLVGAGLLFGAIRAIEKERR